MNDGMVSAFFTYDDVTHSILTVGVINNGLAGKLTATLRDPSTQAVVYGPRTINESAGTHIDDVSGLGLSMRQVTGRGGTGWAPPFDVNLSWASA